MPSQRDVLRLALEADISVPTAKKALIQGPGAVKGRAGEKAAEAMTRLGWTPAGGAPVDPSRAA